MSKIKDQGGGSVDEQDLVYRLDTRAEIRRAAKGRKGVGEGKPDRIADILEEAATEIKRLRGEITALGNSCTQASRTVDTLIKQLRTYANDE